MSKNPGTLYYFTLFMSPVYLLAGLYLIFAESPAEFLPGWKHTVLGVLLIIYAGIRIARLKNIRRSMENDN